MTFTDETTVPSFRFFECDATRVDPDIADALCREFEYTIGPGYFFEFQMEERDFYAILSVIDCHNALALIELGMTTPDEVVKFLRRHDLQHLIRDNSRLTETAKRLGVPVGVFINVYSTGHRMVDAYVRITKGLEKYAELKGKRYCRTTLLPLMVSGLVSYEDAEAVGYELIEEHGGIPEVVSALIVLNSREEAKKFSASDIHRALASNLRPFRTAQVKLLLLFGEATTFAIQNAVAIFRICHQEELTQRYRVDTKMALFIDAVISETARLSLETGIDQPELPAISVIERMLGAGVDPVWLSGHIMGDTWDENHIMALHNGITQPLTSGWL